MTRGITTPPEVSRARRLMHQSFRANERKSDAICKAEQKDRQSEFSSEKLRARALLMYGDKKEELHIALGFKVRCL